jgi:tripartite-type tricarboxylate transporter receptor subunit TctC
LIDLRLEQVLNKKFLSHWALRSSIAMLGLAFAGGVAAQAFPSKPIRLVIPFAPGGVVDVTARQIGPKLSEALGQPVLIDNRSGAGGTLAADHAAKSAPDGHTLLVAFDSHAVNPHIYKQDLRYDTFKDFAPISFIGSIPLLLATSPAFPAKDIPSFIQVAKSKPGTISYASVGAGSSGHLAAEQLKLLANVDMLHIPYKGGAPALSALMGEQVQLIVFAAGAGVPLVRSAKIKALAVSGTRRSSALPGVPTMAEAGYPQLDSGAWMGLLAPAGTPAPVIARLNSELAKVLNDPELIKKLADQAVDLSSSTPEELGSLIRAEHDKWGKVIRDAKLNVSQ